MRSLRQKLLLPFGMVFSLLTKWADQMGCSRIEINSDFLEVVRTLQDGGVSTSPTSTVYLDCYNFARSFTHVIIERCTRDSNGVAHLLVSHREQSDPLVWINNPSDFIVASFVDNVTIIHNQ